MSVDALDRYYLSITLLVTTAYQLLGFFIAWTFQFDKITDFTGGSNFFILSLLTLLLGNEFHTRSIVASVLVMVWATRIAGFLLFRVLKTGSDNRFDDIRAHFFKFLGFWIAQILWVWIVSLPLTVLNSPAVSSPGQPPFGTSRDIAGIVIWSVGWVVESVADQQKFYYKSHKKIPKDEPMRAGVWAWSRHPPYFGEILCWFGIWTLCLSPTTNGSPALPNSVRSAQFGTVVSPVFTFLLLMFASGVPTAEKPQAKKFFLMSHAAPSPPPSDAASESQQAISSAAPSQAWTKYKEYLNSTSILIPIPPVLYKPLPEVVKKTLLMDFGMYRFDEERDGKAALEERDAGK